MNWETTLNSYGIGISNEKVKLDGIAYLNLKLEGTSKEQFLLNYEPVLISRHIDR